MSGSTRVRGKNLKLDQGFDLGRGRRVRISLDAEGQAEAAATSPVMITSPDWSRVNVTSPTGAPLIVHSW